MSAPDRLAAAINKTLAAAPPLTAERRDQLARLLRDGGGAR